MFFFQTVKNIGESDLVIQRRVDCDASLQALVSAAKTDNVILIDANSKAMPWKIDLISYYSEGAASSQTSAKQLQVVGLPGVSSPTPQRLPADKSAANASMAAQPLALKS